MQCSPRIFLGIHRTVADAATSDAALDAADRWHEAGLQAPITSDADALAVLDALLDDADALDLPARHRAALRNLRSHVAGPR